MHGRQLHWEKLGIRMVPVFRAFGDLNRMKIVKVMDFDCGGGVSTRGRAKLLSGEGEITGVDISSAMVRRAEKRLRRYPNARIVKGELPALDLEDSTFDKATMIYAIHDIARKKGEEVVTALARVLKPGGRNMSPRTDETRPRSTCR